MKLRFVYENQILKVFHHEGEARFLVNDCRSLKGDETEEKETEREKKT